MAKNNADFFYEIEKGFDFILEEKANSSKNLRRVSWNGGPSKIDIREWSYNEAEERALKGVTLTDEGANELANVLVEVGFGDTDRLIKALESRNGTSSKDEVYYDPKDLVG